MDNDTELLSSKEGDERWKWIFLLAVLRLGRSFASSKWQKFEQEIINQNRYFPDVTAIHNAIKSFSEKTIKHLRAGDIIYRARVIPPSDLPERTKEVLEEIFPADIPNTDLEDHIKNLPENLQHEIRKIDFWGYPIEKSGAPPQDKATSGRANPKGIPYLYASEEPRTAVYEARPIIRQIISVAEIEIKDGFKLFDFCSILGCKDDGSDLDELFMLSFISERFATPNHQEEHGYYATQYICEMLKKEFEFDGIRFKSSLHEGGINIVLFGKSSNYEIKNTSLHIVKNIVIDEKQVLPLSV